jgi:hypothetical protein
MKEYPRERPWGARARVFCEVRTSSAYEKVVIPVTGGEGARGVFSMRHEYLLQ